MPQIRHIFKRAKKRKQALFTSHVANMPPPGFWVIPLSSIYFHQETEIPAASKQGNSLVILDLLETREYSWGTAGYSERNRKSNLEKKESSNSNLAQFWF